MKTIRLNRAQFPFLLKQMKMQPPFLDCAGTLPPNDENKFLCVVGARKYSEYGRDACLKLINGLKGYPVVIVSGLALGIDSIAHEVALNVGLRTIAFPGSGLSRQVLYPPSHLHLAERIIESGNTLLSPFERNQIGIKWTFPVRNQLMAGISHAVLVIEGREGSGTLLTAKYAIDLNRDVLVVPGSIFSDLSYGPHKLFKDGATPITTSNEILSALGFDMGDNNSENTQMSFELSAQSLSIEERSIIQALQYSPLSASDLIEKTSLSSMKFNVLISQLELNDFVTQNNGIYRLHRYSFT